jgi:hypothetical protein
LKFAAEQKLAMGMTERAVASIRHSDCVWRRASAPSTITMKLRPAGNGYPAGSNAASRFSLWGASR